MDDKQGPSLGKQVLKSLGFFLLKSHRLRFIVFVQPDNGIGPVVGFDSYDAVDVYIRVAILNKLHNRPSPSFDGNTACSAG
jgi:hypothetical protein